MTNDAFLNGYYERLFIRKSCSKCHFARRDRTGDITMADAWQIEKILPVWNSHEGVSLVFLNTIKGKHVFNSVKNNLEVKETSMEWATSVQDVLSSPTILHKKRAKFFNSLNNKEFSKLVFKNTHISIFERVINKVIRTIKKI